LCALLLAGTGCKKNALGDVYISGGYSVKENTDVDKEEFPYLVSKD